MRFVLRFPTLFSSLFAAAANARAQWGYCPHCASVTAWTFDLANPDHRCTECRRPVRG